MSLLITLLAALIALIWAGKIKKRTTKLATVLLALSSLIDYTPYLKGYGIGQYTFIFFSFFAAIESYNSLRLSKGQRALFFSMPILIGFFELMDFVSLPFHIPRYPFGLLYLLAFAFYLLLAKKKIFSRAGVLIVWSAVALKWLLPLIR
ncbi:hypothetical protein [Roseivirga misakiensis]|uniref:Uncharacterized protein n=1 Tax=Roseivirga misakiensis TaxID=1563681 RepID=A0A1E5SYI5_9BACT|nr:hypothetical protein [Roseivirga misakiensis]OEK04176.1 hypothetical protein BFP71_11880 [Roseivirga misakiensis]